MTISVSYFYSNVSLFCQCLTFASPYFSFTCLLQHLQRTFSNIGLNLTPNVFFSNFFEKFLSRRYGSKSYRYLRPVVYSAVDKFYIFLKSSRDIYHKTHQEQPSEYTLEVFASPLFLYETRSQRNLFELSGRLYVWLRP